MISPPKDSASLRLGVFSSTTGYINPAGWNRWDAHWITDKTDSLPYPNFCADCLIHIPVSSRSASAGCKPATPRNSPVSANRTTSDSSSPVRIRESPSCQIGSNASGEAGGFHDMNCAMVALPSLKASTASDAVNALKTKRPEVIDVRERSPDSNMNLLTTLVQGLISPPEQCRKQSGKPIRCLAVAERGIRPFTQVHQFKPRLHS